MKHRVKMKLTKKFTLFSCLPILFSCSYRMGTPPRQIYSDELKNILLTKREFVKDIPYLIGKNDSNSDDFALLSNEEMTISFSCSAFESVYDKQLGTCVSRTKTYDKTSYKYTYEESVTDQLEIGLTYEEFSKFVTNKFGFSIIFLVMTSCHSLKICFWKKKLGLYTKMANHNSLANRIPKTNSMKKKPFKQKSKIFSKINIIMMFGIKKPFPIIKKKSLSL